MGFLGPPLARRRVAAISTAGVHREGDRPFTRGLNDYRVIPGHWPANELTMSHIWPTLIAQVFSKI